MPQEMYLGALLSSKEVIERAAISRATLNNYIALEILPKPEIRMPDRTTARAPRIGYFPSSVLDTLKKVEQLKVKGYTMAQIVDRLKHERQEDAKSGKNVVQPAVFGAQSNSLGLTIDHMNYPGYLLNYKFQMEWCNEMAEKEIFGQALTLSNHIEERNIFQLLFDSQKISNTDGFEDILRFHLSLAKGKLSNSAVLMSDLKLESEGMAQLIHLHDEVEPAKITPLVCTEANLSPRSETAQPAQIFATFFREGIFIIYLPAEDKDSLLTVLARRDLVIRDLLRKRRPYLTQMSVLVADLQSSYKICAELPPEEYFELINSIWNTMESLLRKYYATGGKHVGDGVVYYFFPQPEENHVLNTIRCAQEMKDTMLKINREWRNKKSWSNELLLNIGIDQGEEWFGTYQTATQLEFTVLGETVNRAGRLSDFAKYGSIWTTKNALATLTEKDRESIHFGIKRESTHGPILTPSSYAQISNLIDMEGPGHEKMMDISGLPVTEVFDVTLPDSR